MKYADMSVGVLLGCGTLALGWYIGHSSPRAAPSPSALEEAIRPIECAMERQAAAMEALQVQLSQLALAITELSQAPVPPAVPQPVPSELGSRELTIEQKRQMLRHILGPEFADYSDFWVTNRMLETSDPHLKALAMEVFLDKMQSPDFLLATLEGAKGQEVVAVANKLAEHEAHTRETLLALYTDSGFPGNFGPALALFKQGDFEHLDEWSASALADLSALPANSQISVLGACMAFDVPHRTDIAISASESEHMEVRLQAIRLLARLAPLDGEALKALDRLSQHPDPRTAANAKVATLEIPIALRQR